MVERGLPIDKKEHRVSERDHMGVDCTEHVGGSSKLGNHQSEENQRPYQAQKDFIKF